MVKRYSVSENIYEGLRPGAAMVVVSASDYDALAAELAKEKSQYDFLLAERNNLACEMNGRADTLKARIATLEAALRKIAAYPPGDFRPLADEIAIWKIATEALETELPLSVRAEQGIIDQCFPAETPAEPNLPPGWPPGLTYGSEGSDV